MLQQKTGLLLVSSYTCRNTFLIVATSMRLFFQHNLDRRMETGLVTGHNEDPFPTQNVGPKEGRRELNEKAVTVATPLTMKASLQIQQTGQGLECAAPTGCDNDSAKNEMGYAVKGVAIKSVKQDIVMHDELVMTGKIATTAFESARSADGLVQVASLL